MPITYDYSEKHLAVVTRKFSPGVTSFLTGLIAGFIVLPIVLPILGYQVTKRWGPPK